MGAEVTVQEITMIASEVSDLCWNASVSRGPSIMRSVRVTIFVGARWQSAARPFRVMQSQLTVQVQW